jgi:hypothetical protein
MRVYDQNEVCDKFMKYVDRKFGSVAEAVIHYKVTRAYISNIKRYIAAPNEQMLSDIGFERKNGFVRARK